MPSLARTSQRVLECAGKTFLWAAAYAANEYLWTWLFSALGFDSTQQLLGALHFFIYESLKVFLLLTGMIFAIGFLRTGLRPETVRDYLAEKPLTLSLILAAILGAVTPFCSCSSIPLFIGFVSAGVPLSVTLTFLIASPLVNEVAVVMLGQAFGWHITSAYIVSGLLLAIALGALFSRFPLDHYVEEFVHSSPVSRVHHSTQRPTFEERCDAAKEETREIFGRVWKWVLIGVGVGAFIHGWVPSDFLVTYAGNDNPFAVVLVTVLGVPLYSNAAGVIPVAEALWAKGMSVGTTLAFMMATVALSVPELILLKQILKPRLLAAYFASVFAGIILIGIIFNSVF
ncbi:MAG: hypothetical protein CSA82_03745 [Actinobacteria bacterium]|nr:MAG: hypothetical protein CSA82_03745 [Actinomycetota bacterium]